MLNALSYHRVDALARRSLETNVMQCPATFRVSYVLVRRTRSSVFLLVSNVLANTPLTFDGGTVCVSNATGLRSKLWGLMLSVDAIKRKL